MREIKFRYVCKDAMGVMFILFKDITDFLNSGMNIHGRIQEIVSVDQFIGRKDISGNDIYENDIVQEAKLIGPYNATNGRIREYKSKVVFEADGFNVECLESTGEKTEGNIYGIYDTRFEIIGNIHQHSNLLA